MGLSHLSLLQMSFSGAVFILVIILLRVVAINRLPKKMFLALWGIALLRLLIPLSVPSAVSVYSVISQTVDDNTLDQTPIRNIIPVVSSGQAGAGNLIQTTEQAQQLQQAQQTQLQSPQPSQQLLQSQPKLSQQTQQSVSSPQSSPSDPLQTQQTSERTLPVSAWFVVWCVGMILCAMFFVISYLRWYFKFRTSVPVHNDYVEQWVEEHRLKRPIAIRQSDRTAAPLTYGVFRPVILLPNKTDWENTEQLRYILLHEYVHICRFDTVTKFITAIAVCIHWFNPLVWVMYVLFNRDLELSCDESVVRLLGIGSKSDYARVLISMEAKKSGLMPFYNNFSKNAIEERITSIMKTRKTSLLAILAAVVVVSGLTAVFATSARTAKGEDETDTDESFLELTVNRQLLQYIGMTYGQFREQSGVEAESYHANFFTATIPDIAADVVFEGAYDEELGGPVLADDSKIFRIEGSLNVLISGINEQMTIDELTDTLMRNSDFTYTSHLAVQEGGGTAYYVADYYVETGVDSNRDGVEDAVLQIALDGKESDTVSPNAYTWLSVNTSQSNTGDVEEGYMEALVTFPSYYHSVSDVDKTSVYLGGVGGIYEINQSLSRTIYPSPHIAGAALYKNYIYSLEFNVTDNGMTADLIRIKKSDLDKEVLTEVSGASYDLRIVDNILVVSEYNMEDYGPVILFYAYTLDDEGNLTSDTPQDAYAWFDLPDGHEGDMHYLINPWFSTKYLGYSCFTKAAGVMDVNSVWIMWEGQETAEEVVTCHGGPLLTEDTIFYCDSNEQNLIQRALDNAQETVLYEIPDGYSLWLLTYDSEWVYFERYLQISREGGSNELSSAIMRVNMRDHRTEVIYELQPELGQTISNFNVYGNDCYFILGAGGNRWMRCDLINGEVTIIDVDAPLEDASSESIIDGVTMEVTEASDVSLTLKITNETDKNIQFGDDYYLEGRDKESGRWDRLAPIIDNGMFHMVAYMLQDNSTANQDVNFEWFYGKLEPGKYRIVKEITDFRGTGDYTDYTYMAEFDVD